MLGSNRQRKKKGKKSDDLGIDVEGWYDKPKEPKWEYHFKENPDAGNPLLGELREFAPDETAGTDIITREERTKITNYKALDASGLLSDEARKEMEKLRKLYPSMF